MKLDTGWDGQYKLPKGMMYYRKMDWETFSILRPPVSKRYLWLKAELKKEEQKQIDRRWNWYHDTMKRKLFYHPIRWLMKVMRLFNVRI